MAEVKWIKLTTDLFDNRKIKQLRRLPDGDALIVIWMQILCLAGRTNTGGGTVFFADGIPYTDELLAVEFDRPITLIRLALSTFEKFKMIDIIDDVLCVCNWEKYQSEAKLELIREYERDRKREARAKRKEKLLSCPGQVPECPDTDIYSISTSSSKDLNLNETKTLTNKEVDERNYSPLVKEAVNDWLRYKKEKRQSYKKTGLKQLLTQIENRVAEYGEDAVVNVIKESMANNWQGIIWDRLQKHKGQKIEKKEDSKNDKYDYDKFFV